MGRAVGAELGLLVGAATVVNVRETLVPVAVVAVLRVTVVPETAVTVVPDAMPVPDTVLPTTTEEAEVTSVTDVLPDVVLPVVLVTIPAVTLVGADEVGANVGADVGPGVVAPEM